MVDASDVEQRVAQLATTYQRDINCLSDPDRSTRRRALTKLLRRLFEASPEPAVAKAKGKGKGKGK